MIICVLNIHSKKLRISHLVGDLCIMNIHLSLSIRDNIICQSRFTWNDGIPPWQKIKQENEFLAAPGIEQGVEYYKFHLFFFKTLKV